MRKRKGTDAFTVSGGCALATAKTSQTGEAYKLRDERPITPRPAKGSSLEAFQAYYETVYPGGEFNEMLAQGDFEEGGAK